MCLAALREQEELADLLEAKREGRLVVLPCKLGADIFRLGAKEVCAHWQTAYATVYPDEVVMVDDSDNLIFIEDIGKSVFLTREEAEKALKEDA
jgi:peroxiredoxin family protein